MPTEKRRVPQEVRAYVLEELQEHFNSTCRTCPCLAGCTLTPLTPQCIMALVALRTSRVRTVRKAIKNAQDNTTPE